MRRALFVNDWRLTVRLRGRDGREKEKKRRREEGE
jgi:hypothetical protein